MTRMFLITGFLALGVPQEDDRKLPKLIAKLGHGEIDVREKAEKSLVALGASNLPDLRKFASQEKDEEIRARLRRIIHRLTRLDWKSDLNAALKLAAETKKRLLVLSVPATLGGPT